MFPGERTVFNIASFGSYLVPLVIVAIIAFGLFKHENVFELFIGGARDGISAAFSILPALVALMTGVAMFKASGAVDVIVSALAPLGKTLHFPSEVVPLALMRPISGSGSLSVLEQILKTYGPDSLIGRTAAVMQGSTETTFYTIAIYFGSVGITKTRHTVPAALSAEFCGFVMSILAVRMFFG
ncbi:MAG: spore maturation protein [Clostridia bacterium]|nr:spore maturation protein [Clostridia bacterium]MDR3645900.1 spore maturation protein [Clostridia bacterium]